ncbi:MAG: GNAT family N-acetyltransferase [Terrisporobacter sp.]|uniref:GNAT family N-acetyltransferase n=1 Tax=Terrisporobacter sp. TaxID=1965305 RepID=UPI002FC926E6
MFIIKHFKDLTVNEFYEIAKARYEVFACEQKITMENDFDDVDKNSYHAFSLDRGIITSYARIIPKEFSSYEDVSVGRVLVNKDYRENGLAKNLMIKSIEFIKEDLKESNITLSAQYYIKDLYSSLGFNEISPAYDECNIPHIKMQLKL